MDKQNEKGNIPKNLRLLGIIREIESEVHVGEKQQALAWNRIEKKLFAEVKTKKSSRSKLDFFSFEKIRPVFMGFCLLVLGVYLGNGYQEMSRVIERNADLQQEKNITRGGEKSNISSVPEKLIVVDKPDEFVREIASESITNGMSIQISFSDGVYKVDVFGFVSGGNVQNKLKALLKLEDTYEGYDSFSVRKK